MKNVPINQYFIGDCIEVMRREIPDKSVNCVITSPPYATQRQEQYGGIDEKDYAEWTVQYMQEIRRILTDDGNVAINIRPNISNGEIADYMLNTRLALRADGWNEAEELIWIKPDSAPQGSLCRPRRAWESVHWFSKVAQPYCDPTGEGVKKSKRIGLTSIKGIGDYIHSGSESVEGIPRIPDYVRIGTSSNDRSSENNHPAQFPTELAIWLIKLLCPPTGIILDPFLGSGTTASAAQITNRNWIGIEKNIEYEPIIKLRVKYDHFKDDIVSY